MVVFEEAAEVGEEGDGADFAVLGAGGAAGDSELITLEIDFSPDDRRCFAEAHAGEG